MESNTLVWVSLLVTSYNIEAYIDTTMESVFAQKTTFPFEVIVGDDGSEDGTYEKLLLWQQRYPEKMRLFRQPREKGVRYDGPTRASQNRLALLPYVQGRYFLFLDGDDVLCDAQKLQKQVDILELPENKDCVLCAHKVDWYYGECDTRNQVCGNPYKMNVPHKLTAKEYWRDYYYHPDSILCRSTFISHIPAEVCPRYFNDMLIAYCMIQEGNVYYLPDLMVHYRQTGEGIWTSRKKGAGELRELMATEQEMRINPAFRHVAALRHRANMRYWLQNGGRFSQGELEPYLSYAKEDGLLRTLQWANYAKEPFVKRVKMCATYVWYTFCLYAEKGPRAARRLLEKLK